MDPIVLVKQEATSLQEQIPHIPAGDSCINGNREAAQELNIETTACADMKYPFFRDLLKRELKPDLESQMLDVGDLAQETNLQNQDLNNLGCKLQEVASLENNNDTPAFGASFKSCQVKHADINCSQKECQDKHADINGSQKECQDKHAAFNCSQKEYEVVLLGEDCVKASSSCASVKTEENPHFTGSETLLRVEGNVHIKSCREEEPDECDVYVERDECDVYVERDECDVSVEGDIHIKNCREEEPDECDVSAMLLAPVPVLEKQKRSETKLVYACDDCGLMFNNFSRLKTHIRSHIEEDVHKPNDCGVTVASKNGTLKHKRTQKCSKRELKHPSVKSHKRTHIKKLIYICDDCGMRFDVIEKLKRHIQTHLEEILHKCDICGAAFSYKCNLLRHKTLHEGKKPFKCEFCGLSFSSSYTEQEHRRTHTGEKPHLCEVCGAAFTSHGNMLKHRRVHTGDKPYLCDVCGVAFAWPWHLESHKRTHTGEKPFKCKFCGAGFVANSNLKKHIVIHTGERNYECDVCGKRFARQTNLRSHLRVHGVKK